MPITLHLSESTEKQLERLAAAEGCPDIAAYVQSLVEQRVRLESATAELLDEFDRLARQWREETKYLSIAKRMAEHPAYQKIIAMGEKVIPVIFAEMERRPEHWFFALRQLTGANPIPKESRGKLKEMTGAWLQWGREHGYQW